MSKPLQRLHPNALVSLVLQTLYLYHAHISLVHNMSGGASVQLNTEHWAQLDGIAHHESLQQHAKHRHVLTSAEVEATLTHAWVILSGWNALLILPLNRRSDAVPHLCLVLHEPGCSHSTHEEYFVVRPLIIAACV